MNYKAPGKLVPLQVYCPFRSQNFSCISRDQNRLRKRVVVGQENSFNGRIKSFSRLYYQPAIRFTSFHQSHVTGKQRIPRRLSKIHSELIGIASEDLLIENIEENSKIVEETAAIAR